MKILLTGATGFVGFHAAHNLLKNNHEVWVLVRSPDKLDSSLQGKVHILCSDLHQCHGCENLPESVDAVVHVAGTIKARKKEDYHHVNVGGTQRVFELAQKLKASQFIFISSLTARGPNNRKDLSKDEPVSYYGQSKKEAEEWLEKNHGSMSLVIIRPPIVYGPRDLETLQLFQFFKLGIFPSVKVSDYRLSFIHVMDLVQSMTDALKLRGSYYNVCFDDGACGYSFEEVIQTASRIYQKNIFVFSIPLFIAYIVCAFNSLVSLVFKTVPFLSLDKYKEIKNGSWYCTDYSGGQLIHPYYKSIRLEEGFSSTKKWYEENGWIK